MSVLATGNASSRGAAASLGYIVRLRLKTRQKKKKEGVERKVEGKEKRFYSFRDMSFAITVQSCGFFFFFRKQGSSFLFTENLSGTHRHFGIY